MVTIRHAQKSDAIRLLPIYEPYVVSTAISFETKLPSKEEFASRIEKYGLKYPWLLLEVGGQVAGYAYGSLHREREAYQWTCESSIYLAAAYQGRGISGYLYGLLFQLLKVQGFRNVYAAITIPNEASERLHGKCGFEKFAEFNNIGFKFNQWHKVGWWRLQLNDYDLEPRPPILFSELDHDLLGHLFQKTASSIEAKLKS